MPHGAGYDDDERGTGGCYRKRKRLLEEITGERQTRNQLTSDLVTSVRDGSDLTKNSIKLTQAALRKALARCAEYIR